MFGVYGSGMRAIRVFGVSVSGSFHGLPTSIMLGLSKQSVLGA